MAIQTQKRSFNGTFQALNCNLLNNAPQRTTGVDRLSVPWRLAPWRCSLSSPRWGRPMPRQRAPIKMRAPTGQGYACISSSRPILAPRARWPSTEECPPTCAAYAAPLSVPLLAICRRPSLRCARYAPASVERTVHQAWPDQRCSLSL